MNKEQNDRIYEQLQHVIETDIRPRVQGDGGDLKLMEVDDTTIHIEALNECSRCPLTNHCYHDWLESELLGRSQEAQGRQVKLYIRKPYFWDK